MEKKKGKLFVISGSSGVGKGTLLNLLLKQHPDLKLSISTTTRKPRPGEVDGVNYFFTDKQEFLKEVENGEFLEWAEFNGFDKSMNELQVFFLNLVQYVLYKSGI